MKGSLTLSGLRSAVVWIISRRDTKQGERIFVRSHTSLLMLANLTEKSEEEAEAGIFGLSKKKRGRKRGKKGRRPL